MEAHNMRSDHHDNLDETQVCIHDLLGVGMFTAMFQLVFCQTGAEPWFRRV